jgi:hypothetical protein
LARNDQQKQENKLFHQNLDPARPKQELHLVRRPASLQTNREKHRQKEHNWSKEEHD